MRYAQQPLPCRHIRPGARPSEVRHSTTALLPRRQLQRHITTGSPGPRNCVVSGATVGNLRNRLYGSHTNFWPRVAATYSPLDDIRRTLRSWFFARGANAGKINFLFKRKSRARNVGCVCVRVCDRAFVQPPSTRQAPSRCHLVQRELLK